MIRTLMAGFLFLFLAGCGSAPVSESPVSSHDRGIPITPRYRIAIEIADTLPVPDGVTYHHMDKAGLEKAAGVIRELCATENPDKETFGSFVTCGPYVWPEIAGKSRFRDLEGPEMEIMGTHLKGKYIMDDREGAMKVFLFLRNKLAGNRSIVIRTLTEEEIIIFWECILFDMEDPLFIIEGNNIKILIQLSRNNKVVYLDDLSGVSPGGGS